MIPQNIFSILAILAVANALPQDAAASTTDYLAAATSLYGGSYPSFTDTGSLNSELSLLSGMPTLPASVESVLQTAIPTTAQTDLGCAIATTTPGWFKSLPADVKSAITSYNSAYESWYSENSAELGTLTESIPAGCTVAAQATGSGTATTGSSGATKTGSGSSSTGGASRLSGDGLEGFVLAFGILGLLVVL